MDTNSTIEQAKINILSTDSETQLAASKYLSGNGCEEVRTFLISLLDSSESNVRNAAALAIRDLRDNNAIGPLLNAIFKKENYSNTGTLVYALQTLDCSKNLNQLFEILFYQGYESKAMVSMILDDQQFEFTKKDILNIKDEWDYIKTHNEKCPDYNTAKIMIQNAVDGFLPYLGI